LTIALSFHPADGADVGALEDSGWNVLDGNEVSATLRSYATFIGSSKGEIGVAKEGYVVSRCGWFSERSAAYLASGRPVVAQSTGFDKYLPTGAGLIGFSDSAEGAAGIQEVNSRYQWHADYARQVAQEHFSAERVLGQLLNEVYTPHGAAPS
jgi:glycosyltransferase involved in cell wall biosynthesis